MKRARALALFAASSVAALVLAAAACGGTAAQHPPAPPPVATTTAAAPSAAAAPITASVDESVLDKTVKPCDDFYQYACGGWMRSTPIPDDQALWGRSFSTIFLHNQETLRDILADMAAGKRADDPYAKALGDFYGSCMDETALEARGTADLKPALDLVASVRDAESLSRALAHLHETGVNAFFGAGSEQDRMDSSLVIVGVHQAGLGMPDRDYYLETKKAGVKAKYQAYAETLFGLLGDSPTDAKAHAAKILDFETRLARASMTRTDRRDPDKTYHRLERKGLATKAPGLRWETYFAEVGVPAADAINVAQPEFMAAVSDLVKTTPMADLRLYLRFAVARHAAPSLGHAFVDADFTFRQALTGAKVIEPRWKRCVRTIDRLMGEALGQAFVKTAFSEQEKTDVRHMVDNLQSAMGDDIAHLPWMDDATRAEARGKLALFTKKIGYPDHWRDYTALHIDRASYAANVDAGIAFDTHWDYGKVAKPVDRGEWAMSPPTVNAYYRADNNEIVFPAGILQFPFFAPSMTRAMQYGAIGAVMGHEITHGFDDQGRKFDAHGNRRDWWSPTVGAEFEKRAACVAEQFDGFVPVDDLHVNGKLTLGEDIADLGGVKIAYGAFKKAQAEQPTAERYAYTEDEQFFLGYAQVWCQNIRDEEARSRVTTDPHAPGRFRVNGPLSNTPEFAAAFSCKEGDRMVRPAAQRCEVW
jgi:endothelin-converting enzyme/putative endopeptidase